MNQIEPITHETIKRLRKTGQRYEANLLLEAYHKNLAKSWKEGKIQAHKETAKITAFKQKLKKHKLDKQELNKE